VSTISYLAFVHIISGFAKDDHDVTVE